MYQCNNNNHHGKLVEPSTYSQLVNRYIDTLLNLKK